MLKGAKNVPYLEKLLYDSCKKIDIDLTDKQINQFIEYKNMLIEWNKKFNLTAITDEKEIILKHFIDCLAISEGADLSRNKKIIDVGTGAGFPGVPIKIAFPEVQITLLDSLNKRITFLEELSKKLELDNVKCIHSRAEDGGNNNEFRETFDLCISRAVANLSALCEYCLPFVKVGGSFISMKGPDVLEELNSAKNAISILGGNIIEVKTVNIPETDIIHSLVIIKKVKPTPTKYPRKAGKVKKEPII